MDKISLSQELKRLLPLEHYPVKNESYQTDVKTAADMLFMVDSIKPIAGKLVADMGCGNGILGIAAALMGASHVDMYDIDKGAIKTCSENIKLLNLADCSAIEGDLFDVSKKYDIIISNPPFGFQTYFNLDAMIQKFGQISDCFFFIHKDNKNIKLIAEKYGAKTAELGDITLGRTARFHREDSHKLPIVLVYRC